MTVLQTVGNEIESEFYGDTNIPGTYIHARNLQKLVRSVCYEKKTLHGFQMFLHQNQLTF